ncbi:hypothetical protein SNEBB_001798 [Seison nebaliae]|nr:hypothetical protein SNEBB_001798 [Seison nebaliae]
MNVYDCLIGREDFGRWLKGAEETIYCQFVSLRCWVGSGCDKGEGGRHQVDNRLAVYHFTAGALAGIAGAIVTCPLEVLKTRQQSSRYALAKPRIFQSLANIVRMEGTSALFKGVFPHMIGAAPHRAIYFYTYKKLKDAYPDNWWLAPKNGVSAISAGMITSTITNPIWMIKTRVQLDELSHTPLNTKEVIKKIYRLHGLPGFYKGVQASYVGTIDTAIYFIIYEELKKIILTHSQVENTTDFLTVLTASAFCKSIASTLLYPHEVIRTRLREEDGKYRGFFSTLITIKKESGISAWYSGLRTHLIRTIPNTAIVMSTYELFIYLFPKSSFQM